MNEFDLVGAQFLRRKGLSAAPMGVRGRNIAPAGNARTVDLSGFLVAPGIIDLHGDAFERHLAPRRGVVKDLVPALISTDAELAANGITTAILAQFWSWEGGMRSPAFAKGLLEALSGEIGMITDCRVQLRFETHMLQHYAEFECVVDRFGIKYVVFNDHLPHKALTCGKRPPRLTMQALKGGRSPETHLNLMRSLHAQSAEVRPSIAELVKRFRSKNVHMGSHDDTSGEVRQWWRSIGVGISEFPKSFGAAKNAREGGDTIVLGAPNIVRGGSHSSNVSARDLVMRGLCDVLASDYHYPALRQAALKLVAEGDVSLSASWGLISERPAEILGLSDRGVLECGRRADLVIICPKTGQIGATMVAGRFSFLAGEVADRFIK
mgnify:FL=1